MARARERGRPGRGAPSFRLCTAFGEIALESGSEGSLGTSATAIRRRPVALDRRPLASDGRGGRDAAHLGKPLWVPRPGAKAIRTPPLPAVGRAPLAPHRPGPLARTPRRAGGGRIRGGARPTAS